MDRSSFEIVMNRAIAGLPPQFREKLDGVVILIEARSSRSCHGSRSLLGLYQGVPVTEWGREWSGKLPDTITLFQETIEDYAENEEEIPHVIRETLLHEIGHHFGLDHDRIGKMERRWREKRREKG